MDAATGFGFTTERWQDACKNCSMEFDRELVNRQSRAEMQTGCEKSHTGEQRWTDVDSEFYEYVSSQVAIVGFF
eukprot:447889-Lingulodinium_polyedra.AAC.1